MRELRVSIPDDGGGVVLMVGAGVGVSPGCMVGVTGDHMVTIRHIRDIGNNALMELGAQQLAVAIPLLVNDKKKVVMLGSCC